MAPRLIADRYQLLREVSRAPDATYWRAADTLLDREVMLELLRPELAGDAAAVARFRESMRVTARGGASPHGRLLDGGTDGEQQLPFAVFEWGDTSLDVPSREVIPPGSEPVHATAQPPRRVMPEPRDANARRRSAAGRPASRNWALPVLLTALPLAVGIIVVARLLSSSAPSVAQVFAIPTGTVAVSNPVVTPPAPATLAPTTRPLAVNPAPSARAVTPTPTGERVQIANTDGIGVALRDAPGGQRLPGKGYDEGVTVTVLQRQGEWAHIRGDDGREGWVLSVTVPPSR
ncbi:MAG: SH3 domain-containing protein [Chloroflexi bacterium]|nr:SH3 domain-containing protein [Chloroflexota bacterium]MBV9602972.1 SH3 domain-containing protein [Chloroflexota bacterium]